MTTTVRALSASMIGMPAIGLLGSVRGDRIDDVVRADDDGDVDLVRSSPLISSISFSCSYGDVGLGEQHVHVARHAAGDRMDGVLDLGALRLEQRRRDRARCAAPGRPPCRNRAR